MLILTRHPNQKIHIHTSDGCVVVAYKGLRDRQAKIGIEAPDSVKILREEVADTGKTLTPKENNIRELISLVAQSLAGVELD